MNKSLILAVDAMGGENAPLAVIEGLAFFCEKNKDAYFHIFGNQHRINSLLEAYPSLKDRYTLFHTEEMVLDDESPIRALKKFPNSSMRLAIDDVKNERAAGCISSGNTGALMVMAKLVLGAIDNIKRPAIASILPSASGGIVMLDMGANVECDAMNLFQFAVMGTCFSNIVQGIKSPRVGILNVGPEEHKGRDIEKKAYELLKDSKLNFVGFIEPYRMFDNSADVVVTDGFTGNIALKVAESSVHVCKSILKQAFTANLITRIGSFLVAKSLKKQMLKIDPKYNNGAMFIGINGVVVKSHGSSNSRMFEAALIKAYSLAKQNINKQLSESLLEYETIFKDRSSILSKIRDKLGF